MARSSFLLLSATLLLSCVSAADVCPPDAQYSADPSITSLYRPPAEINPETNEHKFVGFLPEYTVCETCMMSWSAGEMYNLTYNVELDNFNYRWQSYVATREFWEDEAKGYGKRVALYQTCPGPYKKETLLATSSLCVIPDDVKFLGESCSQYSECHNDFVKDYVDVTCAPSNDDAADPQYKCMLDEDYKDLPSISLDCDCVGLLWCASDDCKGAMCVMSEGDGKKHCRYTDEDLVLHGGGCSNCRADEKNACKKFEAAALA